MPLEQFQGWLQARNRMRAPLDELLRGFAETCPECPGGDRRARLNEALDTLARDGILALPRDTRANWDLVGSPRLPRFVTIQRERTARHDFTRVAWVPELSFAVDIRQTRQLEALARINAFLIANRGQLETVVPYRERSLQIFGDEKYLDGVVSGNSLFGRVPLSVISACNPEPPLPREDFAAPGKPLLLVENHHTYWSLLQWNALALRYSSIAYGAGNTIMKSAPAVLAALQQSGASCIEYFGDLDPAGLAIPTGLNVGLAALGGGPVRPSVEIYALLLDKGVRRPLGTGKRLIASSTALAWLPDALRAHVQAVFDAGEWLPQEGVGLALLKGYGPMTCADQVVAPFPPS